MLITVSSPSPHGGGDVEECATRQRGRFGHLAGFGAGPSSTPVARPLPRFAGEERGEIWPSKSILTSI